MRSRRGHHGPAGHRRGALRLLRGRLRPRQRHRHPRRRAADGLLARADAGRHVPAVGSRLAPRRAPASTRSRRTSRTAGCDPSDHDPIPIGVFLDYTDWFREQKGLDVDERLVDRPEPTPDGGFVATLDDGSTITAEKVLAAPGHPPLRQPARRGTTTCRRHRRAHTSELVSFDDLAGARVVIIGGRQSAYEWAALLCDHGAERGRRGAPPPDARRSRRVSWAFVDPYVEQTLAQRGWWRAAVRADEQQAIAAGVLAGRPAHAGALAGAAADARRRRPATRAARSSTSAAATRDVTLTLSDGTDADRRPRGVRLGLPGRPRPGALPRPASWTGSRSPTASPT